MKTLAPFKPPSLPAAVLTALLDVPQITWMSQLTSLICFLCLSVVVSSI